MASSVERYAVYWVDLGPARGSEIAKTRPALVVSDDAMNRMLSTVDVQGSGEVGMQFCLYGRRKDARTILRAEHQMD